VVMAGGWSLRKGCDVLTDAWRQLPATPATTLLHVGGVQDAPVPTDAGFVAAGFVPQPVLHDHYAQSNVFALASREEGLAVVQVQALASGLRLVCTENTGGEDLREFLGDPGLISVVPVDDAAAFSRALADALDQGPPDTPTRDLLGDARRHFSWGAYAKRWESNLLEITS
jgi:starch synthase